MNETCVARRAVLQGAALLPLAGAARAATGSSAMPTIASPDGLLAVRLHLGGDVPAWSARYRGKVILDVSPLGVVLPNGERFAAGAKPGTPVTRKIDTRWVPVWGTAASHPDRCNELTVEMAAGALRYAIIVRAYDHGIAVRYRLIAAPGGSVTLGGEETHFALPPDAVLTASRDEGAWTDSLQTALAPTPRPPLSKSSDPQPLGDVPVLVRLGDGTAMLITESDRIGYPRLALRSTPSGLVSHLLRFPARATGFVGTTQTGAELSFTVKTPFEAPWRLLAVAPSPLALIEAAPLVPTLARPSRVGDISWIRGGKAFRVGTFTNAGVRAGIAFAVARKLQFIELDAHWYGTGKDGDDAIAPIPGLDLPMLIAEARAVGIGVLLYVDRAPLMRQLEAILVIYRGWGVAGIKFGFVWEGRQSDNALIEHVLERCAANRLLVSLHDNLRPAGLERVWPNYIALEGVAGNEQFPTARHDVTLAYTRAVAGPLDYTICYAHPKNQTTNAHQLALAVTLHCPVTFLYWYDKPEKYAVPPPALAFFDAVPTRWDATVPIAGSFPDFVAVARRSGERWFVGVTNGLDARDITLPTEFLGGGRWKFVGYGDGAPAGTPRLTPVVALPGTIRAGAPLELRLAPSGGQALVFERA